MLLVPNFSIMEIITSDRIIKSNYDVIIIGAGLGGLTTASLLAKCGIDVLLIEQHDLPGGACTSFRREDRSYDCGAALIFGFGKEGYHLIRTLINILEEPINVIPRDKFFRLDFAGEKILVWKNIQNFISELEKIFIDEKNEIKALYSYLMDLYERYIKDQDLLTPPSEMSNSQKLKMFLSNPIRTLKLRKFLSMSAADLMGSNIYSKKLFEFYDKLCASYAYINMKEMPAIMALTMFIDNHLGGTYYVAGGAQTYSNTLEKSIEKNGGTILYRQKVEKIKFRNEKACGVELSDGNIITGSYIVSDTTVWNLFFNLLPEERVTDKQRRWVNSLIPTYPAMVLYASVDKNIFAPDTNAVEYYVSNTSEIDMGDITLYIPTIDDHSLGPENEHIITIFSPSPNQKWPRPFEKEYQSKEYIQKKQKQANLILDRIEKNIPNFRKGIKKLYIATPTTIERYTLKTWGCVGGPKQMIGQELTKRLHAKTAFPGLYSCGDSTTMGMGMPATTASGFGCANMILREKGMQEYHSKNFEKEYVNYIKNNPKSKIPDSIKDNPVNASLIARECQYCENPPCKKGCPAIMDIPGIIRRIEAKNYVGAVKIIYETNPLAEICGYICPSAELCEKNCIRTRFSSKPVKIKELHRWVVKHVEREGISLTIAPSNSKKVGVIGSGPAGLSCSHFLARLGYDIDLFDSSKKIGERLHKQLSGSNVPEKVYTRELSNLLLPNINFIGNWNLNEKKQLQYLYQNYKSVFLTLKLNSELQVEDLEKNAKNIFIGGKAYAKIQKKYEVVHGVKDGRKAAMKIHNTI